MGRVLPPGSGWWGEWSDKSGKQHRAEFETEAEAVAHVAGRAAGGLRFHDLLHSYATWLVSAGAPINDVRAAMGHEQASTTLDRYTHRQDEYDRRILVALSKAAAFSPPDSDDLG